MHLSGGNPSAPHSSGEASDNHQSSLPTREDLGPFTDLTSDRPTSGGFSIDPISGRMRPMIDPNWAHIPPQEASYIARFDGEVGNYGLVNVIHAPNHHFTNRQKQLLMERHMKKYDFPVLSLSKKIVEPVSIHRGHGPHYFLGHPANFVMIKEMIEREEDPRKREMMYKNIQVFQQAMTHLHASDKAAIAHKPSETILLSPRHDQDTGDVFYRYATGLYPKLINKQDRVHFKTSLRKKHKTRNPQGWREELRSGGYVGGNGKGYGDETSSEEEDNVEYPVANRVGPR